MSPNRVLWATLILASSTPVQAQTLTRAIRDFDQGLYSAAKVTLLSLDKPTNKSPNVPYYLGRIALVQDSPDVAVTRFERAVELDDRSALYHTWLGSALGEAGQRVSMLKQAGFAVRMKSQLERAIELDPNQLDARTSLLQFYTVVPAMMGGSKDKAQIQLQEITKRNPLRGALMRAWIARQDKDAVAEEAAYRAAIAAKPDTTAGYVALADFYAREKNPKAAFNAIDQYTRRRPTDRWNAYNIGRTAAQTGEQLDRGEKSLKEFIAKPPANSASPVLARAHFWLGRIEEKRGATTAARAKYQTALKLDPDNLNPKKALDALK